MTRFFLLTIFLLHYGPVYAGWLAVEKQYQPIGLETLYFDPETIHRNGIRATLWQLTDLKWNNTTAAPFSPRRLLDVIVEEELVRMRPQPHRIDLLAPLVADPSLDQVLGKHLSLEQKLMILF